jgi:hypothetical protein
MKPCISEATTLPGTFADEVHAYADTGCTAMEVWLTKLEMHLETHSVAVPAYGSFQVYQPGDAVPIVLDGRRLLTASVEGLARGEVKVWDATPRPEER